MNFAAQPMLQPLYSTGFAPPPINMQPPLNLQHSFQPRSDLLSPFTSQPQIILQQTSPTLPQQIQFPPSATQNLTPAPSSQIDDVPQPKPPTGWSLVGSSTSIDQTYTTLQYTTSTYFRRQLSRRRHLFLLTSSRPQSLKAGLQRNRRSQSIRTPSNIPTDTS